MASTAPTSSGSVQSTASNSSNTNDSTALSPKKTLNTRANQLRKRGGRYSLHIKDMAEEEQDKAYLFDLDGDGELDEAELAMMRYDVDGDGNLTSAEIHA